MIALTAYRGHTGVAEYSTEDNLFTGKIVGIRDTVLFDAPDPETLQDRFHGAVDEYLAFCEAEAKQA